MGKRWSFERIVAVTNVVVLVVGAALTSAAWYPKMKLDLFQVQANSQTPTVPDGELRVVDLTPGAVGSHLYDISYAVSTKNTSLAPIRITFSIAELYVGVLSSAQIGLHQAQEVNDPPNPWDDAGRGDITWQRVDYDASLIDGFKPSRTSTGFPLLAAERTPYENLSPGGGLTGTVAPGDATSDTPDFLVRAMPGEYVSLVYSYGINGEVKSPSPNINLLFEVTRLPGGR